jgi:hypothetical protein
MVRLEARLSFLRFGHLGGFSPPPPGGIPPLAFKAPPGSPGGFSFGVL